MNEMDPVVTNLIARETFSSIYWFLVIVGFTFGTWFLFRLSKRPFNYFWRRGYDRRGRLVRVQTLVRIGLTLIITLFAIERVFAASTLIGLALVVILLVGGLIALSDVAKDFIAGIAFGARTSLHQGSRLKAGSIEGNVISIEPLQVRLLTDRGTIALVPYSRLRQDAMEFSQEASGHPIELEITIPDGSVLSLDNLHHFATSSPFRRSNSPITIEQLDHDATIKARIQFYVWSADMITEARNHFYDQVRSVLKEGR